MIKKYITGLTIILFVFFCLWIYNFFANREYRKVEYSYEDAAKYIYESDYLVANEAQELIITRDEINMILEEKPLKKDCNGYVVISINKKIKYHAYIKCEDSYYTKGFNYQNLQ